MLAALAVIGRLLRAARYRVLPAERLPRLLPGPAPLLAIWPPRACGRACPPLRAHHPPASPHLQVKPPICFTEQQADRMVDAMAAVLEALTAEDKARLAEASCAEVQAVTERHRRLS